MAGLHPFLKRLSEVLPRFARQYGITVKVTSGYRSPAKQRKLYGAYLAGNMPYVVARPGTSKHEKGLALDLVTDNLEWLVSVLTSIGLRWAGPKDPVHFEIP